MGNLAHGVVGRLPRHDDVLGHATNSTLVEIWNAGSLDRPRWAPLGSRWWMMKLVNSKVVQSCAPRVHIVAVG